MLSPTTLSAGAAKRPPDDAATSWTTASDPPKKSALREGDIFGPTFGQRPFAQKLGQSAANQTVASDRTPYVPAAPAAASPADDRYAVASDAAAPPPAPPPAASTVPAVHVDAPSAIAAKEPADPFHSRGDRSVSTTATTTGTSAAARIEEPLGPGPTARTAEPLGPGAAARMDEPVGAGRNVRMEEPAAASTPLRFGGASYSSPSPYPSSSASSSPAPAQKSSYASGSAYGSGSMSSYASGSAHGSESSYAPAAPYSPPTGSSAAAPRKLTNSDSAAASDAAVSSPNNAANAAGAAGTYEVQPNDNFWVISEKVYGTGAYFKALAEHNRPAAAGSNHLRVGETLSTPPVAQLEQSYPDLCPKASRREAVRTRASLVSTHGAYAGGRAYQVQEGDTLYDIARNELGKASRWAEIYELNREALGKDFDYLTPGMRLTLPAKDAPPADDKTTRRSGTLYDR